MTAIAGQGSPRFAILSLVPFSMSPGCSLAPIGGGPYSNPAGRTGATVLPGERSALNRSRSLTAPVLSAEG